MDTISFNKVSWFSKLFKEYCNGNPELSEFYAFEPSKSGIELAAANRTFPKENREILVNALSKQYSKVAGYEGSLTQKNINRLGLPNVYTVTTGQQLHPFLGPLMVFNKIDAAISVAEEMSMVPVFWMASEDHDFEEVKSFKFLGRDYTWESNESGAVGRFSCEGLVSLISIIKEDFKDDLKVLDFISVYERIYAKHKNYADATREIVHHLYGEEGLVVVDGDDLSLKNLFRPYIENELDKGLCYESMHSTNASLKEKGYKPHLNAMDKNLFLLQEGKREKKSNEEIGKHLLNMESISPNVAMRPLYQEVILPNVAYFAGPSELAYWLQLKRQFDLQGISYPVVLPRIFTIPLKSKEFKVLSKLGIKPESMFLAEEELRNEFLNVYDNEFYTQIEKLKESYEELSRIASEKGARYYKIVKPLKKSALENLKELFGELESLPDFKENLARLMAIKSKNFDAPIERKKLGVERRINGSNSAKIQVNYFGSQLFKSLLLVDN